MKSPAHRRHPASPEVESRSALARLEDCLAGGMGSGGRLAHRELVLARGGGAEVFDLDGNSHIDYVLAFGSLILGHAPEALREVLAAGFARGTMFGAACEAELELARQVCAILPCAGRVRFTNSGTEAVMGAVRLARSATRRDKVFVFNGHFHGWSDTSFFAAQRASEGETVAGLAAPLSPGQAKGAAGDVIVGQWNDRDSVTRLMERHGRHVACLLLEPYPTGRGCIPPADGFLQFLQDIAQAYGALIIFDEVVSGFRFALGGAQAMFGVTPDLCVFGKALGGGLPISGFAGRTELMDQLRSNRVVHLGTYNSNSLCAAAASAVLTVLAQDDGAVLRRITRLGGMLRDLLNSIFAELAVPFCCAGPGPVISIFAAPTPPQDFRDTAAHDSELLAQLHRLLLRNGVWFLARGNFMLSAAHTEAHIEETAQTLRRVLAAEMIWRKW